MRNISVKLPKMRITSSSETWMRKHLLKANFPLCNKQKPVRLQRYLPMISHAFHRQFWSAKPKVMAKNSSD